MKLLNAAVMPLAGVYVLESITPGEFASEVTRAFSEGTLNHYIGYPETLSVIRDWTGCDLGKTNVAQTELVDKEQFLILRLDRRVSSEEKKVRTVDAKMSLTVEDFLFYRCTYHADAVSLVRKEKKG